MRFKAQTITMPFERLRSSTIRPALIAVFITVVSLEGLLTAAQSLPELQQLTPGVAVATSLLPDDLNLFALQCVDSKTQAVSVSIQDTADTVQAFLSASPSTFDWYASNTVICRISIDG